MYTEIWILDDNGNFKELACYTLPPKEALICFRQQNEFRNYNTWDYPKDDPAIKKYKNKNEYCYFKCGNTSIFTRTKKYNIGEENK